MKKTMGFILSFALLLTAAGCGSDEDVRGTVEPAATEATEAADTTEAAEDTTEAAEGGEETTEAFEFGEVSANVYENKLIGLGCELSSDWTFQSDEEIMAMNNLALDNMDADLAEMVEDATLIYDMAATYSDGMSSVNVNLENVGVAGYALYSEKDSLENAQSMLPDTFESMGYENVVTELTTVTVAGQEFDALTTSANIGDFEMHQLVFVKKCGGRYFANISVTTVGEDFIQDVLDTFYVVE